MSDPNQTPADDRRFMDIAIAEAIGGAGEGGIPVGAALAWRGVLISKGRNQRQQKHVITLHGETDCLANAGLFGRWRETTLYTTLSPCMMCAGTIVQFGIPRVVIADTTNFGGNEDFLRSRGVSLTLLEDQYMIEFFKRWCAGNQEKWRGDIGVD